MGMRTGVLESAFDPAGSRGLSARCRRLGRAAVSLLAALRPRQQPRVVLGAAARLSYFGGRLADRTAVRKVVLREPEQQRVELLPLAFLERREELVLELAPRARAALRASSARRASSRRCGADGRAGSRCRSTRPCLLELVEQADELAAVVAERVGDRALRLARSFVEDGEHRVVVRVRGPARSYASSDRSLRGQAEPLEQERRRRDELPGSGGWVTAVGVVDMS